MPVVVAVNGQMRPMGLAVLVVAVVLAATGWRNAGTGTNTGGGGGGSRR